MTGESAAASAPLDDPVEAWLAGVVSMGNRSPAEVAHAMAEDGFPEHQARIFALAAAIRYGSMPITGLFENDALRSALSEVRQHLGAALQEFHATNPVEPYGGLRRPDDIRGGRLGLGDASATVQFLGRHPPVLMLSDVLSAEECAHLIERAASRMRDSEVWHRTAGSAVTPHVRSSSTAFLEHGETDIQRRIEERIARLVGLPFSHCEHITVTFYRAGGQFLPHRDYLEGEGGAGAVFGEEGDRVATVIVYLNDVESGGGTFFPATGIEVRPQRGGALYFSYRHPDGRPDPGSLHAGLPVESGQKWIATFWFHEGPFRPAVT